MISVVDVSVAVKWFAPDGDGTDARAERVLHELIAHPRRFVVPELFVYELLSVLCRRLAQASDVARALDRISRLGLRRVPLDAKSIRRAVRLAFDHGLTGYDACYAALAMDTDGVWLTFDEAARNRLAGLDLCRAP